MIKYKQVVLFFFLLSVSFSAVSDESPHVDNRIALKLTNIEKAEFLQEMRQMLKSTQGIVSGIGEENREKIIKSAKRSGNRMRRATPKSVTKKLPPLFQNIGGPTHMMFEELAIVAEDDDMETLNQYTGKLMNQCLTCHETFKITIIK